jgi:hypothetical protein
VNRMRYGARWNAGGGGRKGAGACHGWGRGIRGMWWAPDGRGVAGDTWAARDDDQKLVGIGGRSSRARGQTTSEGAIAG